MGMLKIAKGIFMGRWIGWIGILMGFELHGIYIFGYQWNSGTYELIGRLHSCKLTSLSGTFGFRGILHSDKLT